MSSKSYLPKLGQQLKGYIIEKIRCGEFIQEVQFPEVPEKELENVAKRKLSKK